MAELRLDQRAQLAERPVVLRDQEQGVVSEPPLPSRLARQTPPAPALGFEPDRAGRIGQCERADERRPPSLVGDVRTKVLFPQWEYDLLKSAADAAGLPASAYVRTNLANDVDMLLRIHRAGGFVINEARRRYTFRLRCGFNDVADAEYDRLWQAPTLSWAELEEAESRVAAADPRPAPKKSLRDPSLRIS